MKSKVLEIKVTLRVKNQLTLPEPIVRWLGVTQGDELIFHMQEDRPGMVQIRPVRHSYAGAAAGVYGTPDEARAYIQSERTSWCER